MHIADHLRVDPDDGYRLSPEPIFDEYRREASYKRVIEAQRDVLDKAVGALAQSPSVDPQFHHLFVQLREVYGNDSARIDNITRADEAFQDLRALFAQQNESSPPSLGIALAKNSLTHFPNTRQFHVIEDHMSPLRAAEYLSCYPAVRGEPTPI